MSAATAKATPAPAPDPQTGWRNYRTAPFWFVPRPLTSEEEVIANITALLQQFYVDPSAISFTTSEVHVALGQIRFEVNFKYGIVRASARDSHGEWDDTLGDGFPEKFADAIFDPSDEKRYQEDLGKAKMLAWHLAEHFKARIKNAVDRGTAYVMARVGSPLAPIERVRPDQWRYFRMRPIVEELEDPDDIPFSDANTHETEADGPAGEVLYAVMFAPGSLPIRRPGRPPRPHPLDRQISEFLLENYVSKPRPTDLRKANLKKITEEKFMGCAASDWIGAWHLVKKDKRFHASWEAGGTRAKPAKK